MPISTALDQLHASVKQNRWFWYFTVFNRIALAAGFLPSGFTKIMGERFTSLSVNHPMGHYLEALHKTGFYYPFIGVLQMTAAFFLLIPRMATLGALIYFPIILNIFVLSVAVRFDGSLLTSPLMVLANLYLLCWDYDKLKYIFPFNRLPEQPARPMLPATFRTFPVRFFAGVAATVLLIACLLLTGFDLKPRNHTRDCLTQCAGSDNPQACQAFCDCIHQQGRSLDDCLARYHQAGPSKQ
ncbi:hypothetical protein [Arsenicibacter rosenii]|uniref:DoxX family protein n=1 Tax=Arsenicibacter rosenii TaxID=1750698 RepID=A0A1S2VNR0_9BACT|nr:hypothetical protein [Arsenicibacter rosenii]OIN60399.1 hypothetical protein BLX24_06125 [Arsenicibacter rosenii]